MNVSYVNNINNLIYKFMYSVSLIIPIYNVADFIEKSLISALNQTFKSIEFILVDDCATDLSMSIAYSIIKTHQRKKDIYIYKHITNSGLSAARNTGLKKATGKYVFFMDSDDTIPLDSIEKHYNLLSNNNFDFTVSNMNLVGARSIHIKDLSIDQNSISPLLSFFQRKWNVSACNKLYSKKFLDKYGLGFCNELTFEDIFWTYKLCIHTNRVGILPDKTYNYIIRRNSITTKKNDRKKIDSILYILSEIINDWNSGAINTKYKKSFCQFITFWRFNASLLLVNYNGDIIERKMLFNKINSSQLKNYQSFGIYSILLYMPFDLFIFFFNTIYYCYKKIQNIL